MDRSPTMGLPDLAVTDAALQWATLGLLSVGVLSYFLGGGSMFDKRSDDEKRIESEVQKLDNELAINEYHRDHCSVQVQALREQLDHDERVTLRGSGSDQDTILGTLEAQLGVAQRLVRIYGERIDALKEKLKISCADLERAKAERHAKEDAAARRTQERADKINKILQERFPNENLNPLDPRFVAIRQEVDAEMANLAASIPAPEPATDLPAGTPPISPQGDPTP